MYYYYYLLCLALPFNSNHQRYLRGTTTTTNFTVPRPGVTDTVPDCYCPAAPLEKILKIASRTLHSALTNVSATDLGLEATA